MQDFTVHPTGSAQRGFETPQKQRGKFSLENTVCIYFCSFQVYPNSPYPYLQVQLNLRKTFKRFKWYSTFGNSLGNLMGNWKIKLASANEPTVSKRVVSSLSWRAVFECVSVSMTTYWFFFLSCFLVKTNWTSHNDFFV